MRLVEEEDQLRLLRIAHLGQLLKQLAHQPQQKRRIQLRRLQQLVRRENIHDAPAARVRLNQVLDIQRRLAEELVASLLPQRDKPALNRAYARRRNIPIVRLELLRVIERIRQHRLQVFEVQQQQPLVV